MSDPLRSSVETRDRDTRPGLARRRLRRVAFACSAIVATALIGALGLADGGRGPDHVGRTDTTPRSARPTATTGAMETTACTPSSATALALLTLTWDTDAQSRLDQIHRVVARADTTGDDATGLVQDLDSYLPTDSVWQQLTRYRTQQHATITSLRTPSSWPAVLAANRTRLGDGTAAFTVHAIRRRDGELDGAPTSASSTVSFTMFVTCPAGTDQYRLLRLSQLDRPLP